MKVELSRQDIFILAAQVHGIIHLVHKVDDEHIIIDREATNEQIEEFARHVENITKLDSSIRTRYHEFYQSDEFDHMNYRHVVRFS